MENEYMFFSQLPGISFATKIDLMVSLSRVKLSNSIDFLAQESQTELFLRIESRKIKKSINEFRRSRAIDLFGGYQIIPPKDWILCLKQYPNTL